MTARWSGACLAPGPSPRHVRWLHRGNRTGRCHLDATTGSYTVKITNHDGGAASCSTCFSVEPAATLGSINPSSVSQGFFGPVTLTGTGVASGATVTCPTGVTFSGVTVVSSTEITATMTVAAEAPTGSSLPVTVVSQFGQP